MNYRQVIVFFNVMLFYFYKEQYSSDNIVILFLLRLRAYLERNLRYIKFLVVVYIEAKGKEDRGDVVQG
jgi:hypothetical protein